MLASKVTRNQLFYRVHWVGHDVDLKWYPASDLKYAPHNLRHFYERNPNQAGPLARLTDWIKAWEDGIDDYDNLDDDIPLFTAPNLRQGPRKSRSGD